ESRGELKEAGRWYLTSAKDGEPRAACALGFLLRDAGDTESAAVWWLRAAQDGDGNAANALGALHAER
ncbi:sel1 repeat family protein, partial [Streptomyces sp. SID5998]|nr:sel1 repeat family protein [Streptomyces sp. SID5998]